MSTAPLNAWILDALEATRVERIERVQSLWGGYGEVVRLRVEGGDHEGTVILKDVQPPPESRQQGERSHARKCRSYDVELQFYRAWASRCDDACRVPRLYSSRAGATSWTLLLEDLDAAGYHATSSQLDTAQRDGCLSWLAQFHATFAGIRPDGLWKTGTYWHLATRPDELARIQDPALVEAAPQLDAALANARYLTFVHGDAKPDNFAFKDGRAAAVDFQYVGGGCGMKDVAYLLHGERASDETRALDTYFTLLRPAVAQRASAHIDVDALEAEWRALYPVAKRDFERFLAGWRG